jgi:hypothetical protein
LLTGTKVQILTPADAPAPESAGNSAAALGVHGVSAKEADAVAGGLVAAAAAADAAAQVSIRQHTSAYVSIRQHTSAYFSIRQHIYIYIYLYIE